MDEIVVKCKAYGNRISVTATDRDGKAYKLEGQNMKVLAHLVIYDVNRTASFDELKELMAHAAKRDIVGLAYNAAKQAFRKHQDEESVHIIVSFCETGSEK